MAATVLETMSVTVQDTVQDTVPETMQEAVPETNSAKTAVSTTAIGMGPEQMSAVTPKTDHDMVSETTLGTTMVQLQQYRPLAINVQETEIVRARVLQVQPTGSDFDPPTVCGSSRMRTKTEMRLPATSRHVQETSTVSSMLGGPSLSKVHSETMCTSVTRLAATTPVVAVEPVVL